MIRHLPCVAVMALLLPAAATATEAAVTPFVAEYAVQYGSFSVGTNRTELRAGDRPGQWVIEARSDARGLARIVAGGTLVQRSVFSVVDGIARPASYRFNDGMERSAKDVSLDFDWAAGRVRGTEEGAAVDVATEPGLQDAASITVTLMLLLQAGRAPGEIVMIEKDRIKHYQYGFVRRERLKLAAGEFETVVYRSVRKGSDRETWYWFAPALGHASVRVEQRRRDKRLFSLSLTRYTAGG